MDAPKAVPNESDNILTQLEDDDDNTIIDNELSSHQSNRLNSKVLLKHIKSSLRSISNLASNAKRIKSNLIKI